MEQVKGSSSYKVVLEQTDVIVEVPMPSNKSSKWGAGMHEIKAHQMVIDGKTVDVPEHWRNGKQYPGANGSKKKVFLNTHYYGLSFRDFGDEIVATVKLLEKTLPDGRVFHMIDVFKSGNKKDLNSNLRANKMAIIAEEAKTHGALRIAGTNSFLTFQTAA